jgi:hypothetical protein
MDYLLESQEILTFRGLKVQRRALMRLSQWLYNGQRSRRLLALAITSNYKKSITCGLEGIRRFALKHAPPSNEEQNVDAFFRENGLSRGLRSLYDFVPRKNKIIADNAYHMRLLTRCFGNWLRLQYVMQEEIEQNNKLSRWSSKRLNKRVIRRMVGRMIRKRRSSFNISISEAVWIDSTCRRYLLRWDILTKAKCSTIAIHLNNLDSIVEPSYKKSLKRLMFGAFDRLKCLALRSRVIAGRKTKLFASTAGTTFHQWRIYNSKQALQVWSISNAEMFSRNRYKYATLHKLSAAVHRGRDSRRAFSCALPKHLENRNFEPMYVALICRGLRRLRSGLPLRALREYRWVTSSAYLLVRRAKRGIHILQGNCRRGKNARMLEGALSHETMLICAHRLIQRWRGFPAKTAQQVAKCAELMDPKSRIYCCLAFGRKYRGLHRLVMKMTVVRASAHNLEVGKTHHACKILRSGLGAFLYSGHRFRRTDGGRIMATFHADMRNLRTALRSLLKWTDARTVSRLSGRALHRPLVFWKLVRLRRGLQCFRKFSDAQIHHRNLRSVAVAEFEREQLRMAAAHWVAGATKVSTGQIASNNLRLARKYGTLWRVRVHERRISRLVQDGIIEPVEPITRNTVTRSVQYRSYPSEYKAVNSSNISASSQCPNPYIWPELVSPKMLTPESTQVHQKRNGAWALDREKKVESGHSIVSFVDSAAVESSTQQGRRRFARVLPEPRRNNLSSGLNAAISPSPIHHLTRHLQPHHVDKKTLDDLSVDLSKLENLDPATLSSSERYRIAKEIIVLVRAISDGQVLEGNSVETC